MKKFSFLLSFVLVFGLVACDKDDDNDVTDENTYKDGTYKSELNDYSHSWKEFMEVTIENENIIAVDIDAMHEDDGRLKSNETNYPMPDPPGLPSTWLPLLEAQYMAVDLSSYSSVDGITGATGTSTNAEGMFQLILDAAKEGDTSTQIYTPE